MGAARTIDAELVDDAGAALGEGPVWDATESALTWVDILSGVVHLNEADGRSRRTIRVGGHVGAALPAAGGGWLLATGDGFSLLGTDGVATVLLDVHGGDPHLRFNDAACDPRGRALAGTMRYDEQAGDATLYRLDLDAGRYRAVPLLQGLGLSNGIGWSPDGGILYFVDSLTWSVRAFGYDIERGELHEPRLFATIERSDGLPDGLCVDAEGGVWVALHGGGCVRRYAPDGALAAVVRVAAPDVTCPGFGGPALDRLFITTGGGRGDPRAGGSPGQPNHRAGRPTPGAPDVVPGAGGIWAAEPGVAGLPATPWRPVPGDPPGPARGEAS